MTDDQEDIDAYEEDDEVEEEEVQKEVHVGECWRKMCASDFKPNDLICRSIKSSEDYITWLKIQMAATDPHMRVKKKGERGTNVRHYVYCDCRGKAKGTGITERYREPKKKGCDVGFSITVTRSGDLVTNIKDNDLLHSSHDDEYKSQSKHDSRVSLEVLIQHSDQVQSVLDNLDLAQVPSFKSFRLSIEIALFKAKRLDRAAVSFLRNAYQRRVYKDFRPSSTLEMFEELCANKEKYHCMPLKDEYNPNNVRLIIRHNVLTYDQLS